MAGLCLKIVTLGFIQFGHSIPKAVVQGSCAEWDENCALSIPNMQFSEDVEQIPDRFVTRWGCEPIIVSEVEDKLPSEQYARSGAHRDKSGVHENDNAAPEKATGFNTLHSL